MSDYIKLDLRIVRGNDNTLPQFSWPEDITGKIISFAAKVDRDIATDRLIDLKYIPGFMNTNFRVSFDLGETLIDIIIPSDKTYAIAQSSLYYDLNYYDPLDPDRQVTIFKGVIDIDPSVQSPLDGYPLPARAVKFAQVDAINAADDELIITSTVNGVRSFNFISLADLKTKLNNII